MLQKQASELTAAFEKELNALIEQDGISKKNRNMDEIIQKYEAKLDYLNKAVEPTKHIMDEDTLDMMNNIKNLLTEVVTDFKAMRALA